MGNDPLHGAEKVDSLEGGRNAGRAEPPPPRAGVTRAWRDTIPRHPHPPFLPVLDRVSRRHARWYPPRVLEPETMDEADEAEAYVDAAAQAHLARLDAGWVEAILAWTSRGPMRVLDVGTGGGQIPALLADRRPEWRIWAVDRSWAMLSAGRRERARAAHRAHRSARPFRLGLAGADARRLPAPDAAFDLVVSNSLLHHLPDPTAVLDEIARVAGPGGRVLLRDLRRPSRLALRAHLAWHGRRYGGAMRRLYEASVAAAFTPYELTLLVRHSRLTGAVVRRAGAYLILDR